MGKWRGSLAVHIILPLLLAVAIGFSTVAGMIIEGTKEYANEGGQKQEDFYVSQKQVEQMMDGYLRLYEQYMQIGSVIAPDGMIDYDTVLLTSLSSGEHKQYTLKELLRRQTVPGFMRADCVLLCPIFRTSAPPESVIRSRHSMRCLQEIRSLLMMDKSTSLRIIPEWA